MSSTNKKIVIFVVIGALLAGGFVVVFLASKPHTGINLNESLRMPLSISAEGPVKILVTNPQGITIATSTLAGGTVEDIVSEIPNELYYFDEGESENGDQIVRVFAPKADVGDYIIYVMPDNLRSTLRRYFELNARSGNEALALASDMPIRDAPIRGFGVRVELDGSLSAFEPMGEGTKVYRNDEWGFEFEYPGYLFRQRHAGGYYTKLMFDLNAVDFGLDDAFLVHIVRPEFVDTMFWKSQQQMSTIVVGGVEGVRYEYEFKGSKYITTILPLREHKLILGTGDGSRPYAEEFNQILSSFKFLDKEE